MGGTSFFNVPPAQRAGRVIQCMIVQFTESIMTLRLSTVDVQSIKQHAAETYPYECCGALVGALNIDGGKDVRQVVRLPNSYSRERAEELGLVADEAGLHNRFIIDPKDLFRTEKAARKKRMSILGFYHSHPNQSPVPSAHDLHVASAGYSYVILSVETGTPGELACWQTDAAHEKFEPEKLLEIL